MCFLSCLCTGVEQAVGAETRVADKRLQTGLGQKRTRRSQMVWINLTRCRGRNNCFTAFKGAFKIVTEHLCMIDPLYCISATENCFLTPKFRSSQAQWREQAKWKLNWKMMPQEEEQICGPYRSRRNDRRQDKQDKRQQIL